LKELVARDALNALGQSSDDVSLDEALERASSVGTVRINEQHMPALITKNITASLGKSSAVTETRFRAILEEPCASFRDPGADLIPTEKYRYEHLGTSKPIIRILQVEPGKKDDPLHCTLDHIDLSTNPPPYEAVSYVWGSSARDTLIVCNGKSLKITRSLHNALCRIRLVDSPRCVWADAICINQDDNEERGYQVGQMLRIYQQASQTLVWLGDDPDLDAITAFSLICVLVNTHELSSGRANFKFAGEDVEPDGKELLSMSSWKLLFDSLAKMYMLRWFWRLWVVQEIVVARSATIMWGQAQISWHWIGLASEWLRTNEHHLLRYFGISGIYNAYLMEHLSRQEDPSRFSILRLLGLTRQFGVTDPRDRIFALLGIPSADSGPGNESLLLQPDYRMSIHDLYRKFARLILDRDKSLRILSAVQHGNHIQESLPSWVPSWDSVYCHGLAPSEPGPNHRAADGLPIEEIKTSNFNHLMLKGIAYDTIIKCTETISPRSFDANENNSLDVFTFTEMVGQFWGEWWDHDRARSLCWTLTAGKDWYGMLVNDFDSHWADFAAFWWEFGVPRKIDDVPGSRYGTKLRTFHDFPERKDGDYDRFLEAASNACVGRRLFLTEKGTLGLGPGALQTGDRCCVLFGGIVPFVLRRLNDRIHALVGECYIKDVMQGEVLQSWRKGEIKTENFCIY
jgi:hypothetical protein